MINEPTNQSADAAVTRLPLNKKPQWCRAGRRPGAATPRRSDPGRRQIGQGLPLLDAGEREGQHQRRAGLRERACQRADRPTSPPSRRPSCKNNKKLPAHRDLERPAPSPRQYRRRLSCQGVRTDERQCERHLEYARLLASVKSPAEFVELTTNHARKHFELIMTHAAALGALSRSLTTRQPDE